MKDIQKGDHTYPIYLEYHRCKFCGKIIESRAPYVEVSNQLIKEICCPRCKKKQDIIKIKR